MGCDCSAFYVQHQKGIRKILAQADSVFDNRLSVCLRVFPNADLQPIQRFLLDRLPPIMCAGELSPSLLRWVSYWAHPTQPAPNAHQDYGGVHWRHHFDSSLGLLRFGISCAVLISAVSVGPTKFLHF